VKYLGNSLVFIFVTILMPACNYNHIRGEGASGKPQDISILAQASLDYQTINYLVLIPRCIQCHSNAGGNKGNLNLETYQQIRQNQAKIYYRSIEKRDMPSNPLPNAEYDLLKNWLEAGSPEHDIGARNAGEIRGPITWTLIKNRVLKSSCLDCHSGKNPDANLNFESLEVVRKNIQAIFVSSVVQMSMPLEPYPSLSNSSKQALMKWISQGMPE
jgi:uncharacterized membrane protein